MNFFTSLFLTLYYPFVIIGAIIVFIFQHPLVALLATVGGLIPPLVWLIFWLQEDRLHPEPKKIILTAFLGGMISIIFVVSIQHLVSTYWAESAFVTLIIFAAVEEIFKYLAAYFSSLRSLYNDEPIDPVIYMISSALGFAALENIFFLNTPLLENNTISGIVVDNLRFMGANLLHVIASAVVGIFIAFAFYKKRWQKRLYLFLGLISAITLHAIFNFSIINDKEHKLMLIFGFVWLFIIIIILILEKIKNLKNQDQ